MAGGNKKRRGLSLGPGDADYKTPTQLRNARKRRKLKIDRLKSMRVQEKNTVGSTNQYSAKSHKVFDPSLRYLENPLKAPTIKAARDFFRDHAAKSSFSVFVGPTTGWRTVAKLAVRMSSGVLCIGLYASGSHKLIEVPRCAAHHPRINTAVEVLQKECRKLKIEPYNEETGNGCLRHVVIGIERLTGRQQITLVWNQNQSWCDEKDAQQTLLKKLCNSLIALSENPHKQKLSMHSLWVHYNNSWKHCNSIVDRNGRWEQRFGKLKAVVEHLTIDPERLTVPLYFPPQVFRQANIDAFSKIVIKIRQWLMEQRLAGCSFKNCLELYGGVGTIGLHLIDLVDSTLVSSDENPFNKECFDHSLQQIEMKVKSKCKRITYESKSATDMIKSPSEILKLADLVVVDPPRKGLDPQVLSALCRPNSSVHSLVYVSCGFDAFCRDFIRITGSGLWQLDHAEGHVLFPGSDAIETLAFFKRR